MRNIIETTKKGFRVAGFVFTWPMAQLYRVIRFFDEIELGSVFAGIAFLICLTGGIIDYASGETLSDIIFFYIILYFLLAGLGSWAINMTLYLLSRLFRPVYQANRRCAQSFHKRGRGIGRKEKFREDVSHPLDRFIEMNRNVKSYEVKRL